MRYGLVIPEKPAQVPFVEAEGSLAEWFIKSSRRIPLLSGRGVAYRLLRHSP
jgi:hypothetical protein